MRVIVRTSGVTMIVLGTGDRLILGRAPGPCPPARAVALPRAGANVSRKLCELTVGAEAVLLTWVGKPSAQLSSLFGAPGGARRVTVAEGLSATLDSGENQLLVLRGRQTPDGRADLTISLDVKTEDRPAVTPIPSGPRLEQSWREVATTPAEGLRPGTEAWYVALALAEPWLTGDDDYPRPPTNREIAERVRVWRGDAGRLTDPRRVDEFIRDLVSLAFGTERPPTRANAVHPMKNLRYAIGRRAAEVGLVTVEQLEDVERNRPDRTDPPAG